MNKKKSQREIVTISADLKKRIHANTKKMLHDNEEGLLEKFKDEPLKQFFILVRKIEAEIELVNTSNKCGIYTSQNVEWLDERIDRAREILKQRPNEAAERFLDNLVDLMLIQRDLDRGEFFNDGSKEEDQLINLAEVIEQNTEWLEEINQNEERGL